MRATLAFNELKVKFGDGSLKRLKTLKQKGISTRNPLKSLYSAAGNFEKSFNLFQVKYIFHCKQN